jgi:hypothetical protein
VRRLALTLALAVLALPVAARADGLPAPGTTHLLIGQTSISYVDAFAKDTGFEPAGGMWYTAAYQAPAPVMGEVARAVTTHPGLEVNLGISLGSVSTPEAPRTALIAAGVYDTELAQLAQDIKAIPTTFYVRIGYEFDLLGGQYGPPATYIAAYRHIVDLFRAAGVKNAVYVWHSAGAFWRATDQSFLGQLEGDYSVPVPAYDPQPITAWYPGRDYVDAFGISYWEDTCCFGRTSAKSRQLYEDRTREILDQVEKIDPAHPLPIVIAESTPAYVGNTSKEWVDHAVDLIDKYDIRVWSLIAMNWQDLSFYSQPFWNGYWPDARFLPGTPAHDELLKRIAQDHDRFVPAS